MVVVTDPMDINDKFRKHYAEQGVAETDLESFNLDELDYVYWGNNSVAFPPFFQTEEVEEVTGYAYTVTTVPKASGFRPSSSSSDLPIHATPLTPWFDCSPLPILTAWRPR